MSRLVAAAARTIPGTVALILGLAILGIAAGRALGLTIVGGTGLYFVVWWTILFAILPMGARSQADEGDVVTGTEPGAPANPDLRRRAIWTTAAASVVFTAVAAIFPLTGL